MKSQNQSWSFDWQEQFWNVSNVFFARQEAKLDRLLEMKATPIKERTASRPSLQFTPCLPLHNQIEKFSTLVPTSRPANSSPQYPTETCQMTPISDLERLLSDSD